MRACSAPIGLYKIGGASREKVPLGYDGDHPCAALLLHEGLIATSDGAIPPEARSADLVDYRADHFARLANPHH